MDKAEAIRTVRAYRATAPRDFPVTAADKQLATKLRRAFLLFPKDATRAYWANR